MVLIAQEPVAAPGPVWMGTVNLVPTGIQTEDRPARTELLHRLSYPGRRIPRCAVLLFAVLVTYTYLLIYLLTYLLTYSMVQSPS